MNNFLITGAPFIVLILATAAAFFMASDDKDVSDKK
ncbi:cytochrome bd oxidase small subunit CydS [Lederbergia graminis]|uniref:Uncharacterized protein n=1 Tax=Lederbergia graminis TaxID=735518 RepID=A0ABW0LNW1_9BACI